jgi:hypothetical protein
MKIILTLFKGSFTHRFPRRSGDELNIKYGSIPISASRDGGVVFPFFSVGAPIYEVLVTVNTRSVTYSVAMTIYEVLSQNPGKSDNLVTGQSQSGN